MTCDNEEEIALDQLLTFSEIIEPFRRYVKANSFEEICAWKSIAPMCIYMKTKRKKESKSKERIKYWKAQYTEESQYRNHMRNLAYYSTNVLSYDSPSSRNIVDLKTYRYIERDNTIAMPNYFVTKNELSKVSEKNNQLFQNYFPEDLDSKKEFYYSDGSHEQYSEIMKEYGNDIPRPIKQPSLFQLQMKSGAAALPFSEQLKLITHKLTSSSCKEREQSKEDLVTKKNEISSDNNKQKYIKINTKFKKKRRYDNELVKIRTCLPPVIQTLANNSKNFGINIDESEDEFDFPFKVSGVKDGKSNKVNQDICIDGYSNLVIDSRDLDCCSRGKYEKIKEKIELPPIAGLHIS